MPTQVTSDPDSILLDQFVRTQDPVAFDQLARRYRGMVFSIARRVTQSHHDAEDVAQSCFLELARKAASIRMPIPAFLHATATRRSIDLLRDHHRRRKYETKAAADRPEPVVEPAVNERSWDEISPEVDQAIERLPDDQKMLVILYFLRGLSIPDIVVETGLNRGMIERRLQVGVRRLRAELAKGDRGVSAGMLAIGFKASAVKSVPATLTAATGRMALAAGLNSHAPLHIGSFSPSSGWKWIGPVLAGIAAVSVIALCSSHWKPQKSGHANQTPYDEMSRVYFPYLEAGETTGFALHASQMRDDASSFWRGSQPLFCEWCKSNCADWFADRDAYAVCHLSPNLEDAERLSILPNTDNSARLPIQIELLQGMIIARLATDHDIDRTSAAGGLADVSEALCQEFRASLNSNPAAVPSPADNGDSLSGDQYIDSNGTLKSLILGRQDKVLAMLRPSPIDAGAAQKMIGDALARNPALKACCGNAPTVRDVRACVRHTAVSTQGNLLLIVQLAGSGTLLEVEQKTPSPAELADAVDRDSRPAAQRAAEDAAMLSPTGTAPVSWCELNGKSFTVLPLNLHPQVYELRKDRWVEPVQAARSWATETAATHRKDPHRTALLAAITPDLQAELVRRSNAYLKSLQKDLQSFSSDPRVARDRAAEDALAASWLDMARRQ